MREMQLSRVTSRGRRELMRLLMGGADGGPVPYEAGERVTFLDDPEFCVPVPGAGKIDLDEAFRSNLDMVKHVWPAVEPLTSGGTDSSIIEDPDVNAFLLAAFMEQIIPPYNGRISVRQPAAYFLDLGHAVSGDDAGTDNTTDGTTRNYRNTIFANLMFYFYNHSDDGLCRTFLGARCGRLTDPISTLIERVDFMCSRGLWRLINAMLMDPCMPGNYHKPIAGKSSEIPASKALKAVVAILYRQFNLTYDVEEMDAVGLFHLLPDLPELDYWLRRASVRLAISQPWAAKDTKAAAVRPPRHAKAMARRIAAKEGPNAVDGIRLAAAGKGALRSTPSRALPV